MPIGWEIAVVFLWLAVISLAIVVLGVLRQVTTALQATPAGPPGMLLEQGPPVGSSLPEFTARNGNGETVSSAQSHGQPVVLLFLSQTCGPCLDLADELGKADPAGHPLLARFLFVVTDLGGPAPLQLPVWAGVLDMPETQATETFGARGRPFAIVADQHGTIQARQLLNTVHQLAGLIASALPPAARHDDAQAAVRI